MNQTPVVDLTLENRAADQVRRSVSLAIKELQRQPAATMVISRGIVVPANGSPVAVAHGLGREPQMVIVGAPRMADTTGQTSGTVYELAEPGRSDRSKTLILQGIGFSKDVTVDVTCY